MEYKATLVGMALILMLFILITFNDVKNLFG
jgi:membrane-associated protease RseP (regulator of RpoE activity)